MRWRGGGKGERGKGDMEEGEGQRKRGSGEMEGVGEGCWREKGIYKGGGAGYENDKC